ncbi:MAG: RNA-binding protein [Candidatus Uhrbacteria bacterium]
MARYTRHLASTQREPIFGRTQVQNRAGGYVFKLDPFATLDRFLILGCEGGTYYASERELAREAATLITNECLRLDTPRTISAIVSASNGRAIKNDPSIFALAVAAASETAAIRRCALAELNNVCRIGTHLFQFVSEVTAMRGWGRSLRAAVANWYTQRTLSDLAYQVTKYQQREGWSHRDLLRLSHPKSSIHDPLFKYVVSGDVTNEKVQTLDVDVLAYLGAIETVKTAKTKQLVVSMIERFGLVREHIPTEWLNDADVWAALLEKMPNTALIRNLGKMTEIGLLKPLSDTSKYVCERLRRMRGVHPFAVLLAQTTYATGHGFRGQLAWSPVPQITAAMDDTFYNAFNSVVPTGKNFLLAIDVSGSMGWRGYSSMGSIANTNVKAYQAAAVMAMATVRVEPWCHVVAFSGELTYSKRRGAITEVGLTSNQRLTEVLKTLEAVPVGPTDCAAPIVYAQERGLDVDAFVVYTDNETWSGTLHPCQALKNYRQARGRDAKLIACGMTATNYTVADPSDPGMLDVVGFDANTPAAISAFVEGLGA